MSNGCGYATPGCGKRIFTYRSVYSVSGKAARSSPPATTRIMCGVSRSVRRTCSAVVLLRTGAPDVWGSEDTDRRDGAGELSRNVRFGVRPRPPPPALPRGRGSVHTHRPPATRTLWLQFSL